MFLNWLETSKLMPGQQNFFTCVFLVFKRPTHGDAQDKAGGENHGVARLALGGFDQGSVPRGLLTWAAYFALFLDLREETGRWACFP